MIEKNIYMTKRLLILFFIFALFIESYAEEQEDSDFSFAYKLQNTFATVAEKALPAVVIVKTAKRIKQYYYLSPDYGGFPHPFFRRPRQIFEKESNPIPSGQASGFILNQDGYILTNYHVIKEQSSFKIAMLNGEEYNAKIVGSDPETDIAVLKIDAKKKLPFLKFADPKTVMVGHFTIAIGAPFGLEHTVTTGIVSYKGRTAGMNLYENYIQTDAAINPGNSGGPLLNLKGEVIGVNDFILSPPGSQGNIGLGFAISGKLAQHIATQLIAKGKAEKPWIGIAMQNLSPKIKNKNGIKHGVLVQALHNDGPADAAGINVGDIITQINGTQINTHEDVKQSVINHLPGDEMTITVKRKGIEKIMTVKIGSRPETNLNKYDYWRTK